MPIPFILGGIGIATGLLGIGTGIKSVVDNNDANDVNAQANLIVDKAKENLEECRTKSYKALEALGGKKAFVLNNGITDFVNAFEKLKNVDIKNSVGHDELKLDKQSLRQLKEMGNYAASILGGVAGGAVGGALAAFGAYSGAMVFGAASTGTAIASLSGVAATNATLAFLGGGSLAVGGLGMAGGAMVLGGLVAGPALAIMGIVLGAKASENLDKARSNLAEARKIAEELQTASVLCNGIRRRSYMFERLLIRLDALFSPLVYRMEEIIEASGVNYPDFTAVDKRTICTAAALAQTIKAVLVTPILTEDGRLTDESKQIASDIQKNLSS
ncbi:MAG: hypothetical protein LBT14_13425 [Treponema sp.]|jgi:hypothetical protein|nr:hypothetical protein [Treponema sp.]